MSNFFSGEEFLMAIDEFIRRELIPLQTVSPILHGYFPAMHNGLLQSIILLIGQIFYDIIFLFL
jgi:hypothetical protein